MSDAQAVADQDASLTAGRRFADAAIWRRLLSAGDLKAFSDAWLNLLCAQVDLALGPLLQQTSVVRQGMVALGAPDSRKYARTAWFGAGKEVSLLLAKAGERSIQVRHGTVQVGEGPGALCQIAYPILVGDAMHGVVALELPSQAKDHLDIAMRMAQWGVAWFAHLLNGAAQPAVPLNDDSLRLTLLETAISSGRLEAAAEAAATLLADQMGVDKVSFGIHRRDNTRLLAVSHGGFANVRNAYMTALIAAMEEAVDAGGHGAFPVADAELAAPHAAHAALARAHGAAWVRSVAVPLTEASTAQLVLLAEGVGSVPDRMDARLQSAAADLAPLVLLRQYAEQGPFGRMWQRTAAAVHARPVWRRAAYMAVPSLLIAAALIPMPYRISADATLETSERRVIAAPFDGYLAAATARPGDRLSAGALLARFDTRDLTHQRSDILERLSETGRELNEAVGLLDRAKASVLTAHKAQIEAELALIEQQMGRADLRAPFDAVVIAGDKTQSIGAPMHRGEPLYELAPAGSFRVNLDVPQVDFATIEPGQTGSLVLSALPYESLPIRVTRLTPIAVAHDGQTVLRAEAELLGNRDLLRLGMQGVADVQVGRARLGWLLTHRIADWLRLKLWAWMP